MASVISKEAGPDFGELEWRLALWRAGHTKERFEPVSEGDERSTPEPIRPERLGLASAGIRHLSEIVRQLVELCNEPTTDEYGILRPTQHAFDAACQLLIDAAIVSARESRAIPYGCASTDSEGGIRIEWVRPTSSVHLVVPASLDRRSYIYHEVGDAYGTMTATPKKLARWLQEIN
jgi:hypothetical protein